MTELKFYAKTLHIQRDHNGSVPRILIYTQANEIVEIVVGDAMARMVEAEVIEPCA